LNSVNEYTTKHEETAIKLLRKNHKLMDVELTEFELIVLNNSLNEVCNGLDLPEFEVRMGATVDEVKEVLKSINLILSGIR